MSVVNHEQAVVGVGQFLIFAVNAYLSLRFKLFEARTESLNSGDAGQFLYHRDSFSSIAILETLFQSRLIVVRLSEVTKIAKISMIPMFFFHFSFCIFNIVCKILQIFLTDNCQRISLFAGSFIFFFHFID